MLGTNPPFSWSAILLVAAICIPNAVLQAQNEYEFEADLDPLITLPAAYELTPDQLDTMFTDGDGAELKDSEGEKKNPYFKWLTKERTRALFMRRPFANVTVDLKLFDNEIPIEEAIVDFRDGKLLGITVSIFNRGDGGDITATEFQRRFKLAGQAIGAQLDIRPKRKKANPAQGMLTEGWMWISARGMAVLEHNPEAPGNTEFLRLRMARRDATGAYASAMNSRPGASVSLSDLPRNVTRDDDGNVYVDNLPMVDQGQKGYCVVASTQRLFEYYGIACDQHQLAQISGADPNKGTSSASIIEELGAIDHLFKTRFEPLGVMFQDGLLYELDKDMYAGKAVDSKQFHRLIRKYIDDGIPLLWALELGKYEEEPSIAQQAGGGHMRMIIGYNDKTDRVIFSDSWGAGHEFKTMDADDCFQATHGLFLLKPTTH